MEGRFEGPTKAKFGENWATQKAHPQPNLAKIGSHGWKFRRPFTANLGEKRFRSKSYSQPIRVKI